MSEFCWLTDRPGPDGKRMTLRHGLRQRNEIELHDDKTP